MGRALDVNLMRRSQVWTCVPSVNVVESCAAGAARLARQPEARLGEDRTVTIPSGALWYAAHTHPNAEFRALDHLSRQNYRAYLPRYAKKTRHARRTRQVLRPFFPRYLFVSLDLTHQGWRPIRSTQGITDIVCFGEQPASLPEGFIESLIAQEDADGCLRVATADRFKPGDSVVVRGGPFSRLTGLCEKMTDNERVAILLDFLGRKVRVVLDAETVEAA